MIFRLLTGILLTAAAATLPFFFEDAIQFSVRTLGMGWVFATVLFRVVVIVLIALAIGQFFALSDRLKRIRWWAILLIALLPGFGISFIAPIYTTDYGLLNDGFTLQPIDLVSSETKTDLVPDTGHAVCAFFTTSCTFCMSACRKFAINIEAGQTIPVYAIFPGTEEDTKRFLEKNNGERLIPLRMSDDSLFVAASGGAFPSIFVIDENGQTEFHWTGDEMNYSALDYLRSLKN